MQLNKTETKFLEKMLTAKVSDLERAIKYCESKVFDENYPNYTENSYLEIKAKHDKTIKMCNRVLDKLKESD